MFNIAKIFFLPKRADKWKSKFVEMFNIAKIFFPAREEEVPDPAAPAEGEYAEYTEEQQYAVGRTLKQ